MATVPVDIPFRPYAVCPPTNLMNPDGFFVANMGDQWIEVSVTNDGGAQLSNVRAYIEGISDPGITRHGEVRDVGDVRPGASFTARFLANFHDAMPGTARVSVVVEADGHTFRRILKKLFITRVDYDKLSKTYSVVMPEGTMRIVIHKAMMGPGQYRCKERGDSFIVLPQDVTYEWVPSPPYAGERGPFPYEDPWWKIALAILAALFVAGALLYDYFSDGDLDGGSVSVSGTFEETDPSVSCCSSVSTSATDSDDLIAKGLYGAAGAAATAAIASDGPDLHYRGQEATVPASGELTLGEGVRLMIDYTEPPSPGTPFKIAGKWQYTRTTTGSTYQFGAEDQRENIHWLDSYQVEAPALHDRASGPLVVRARFVRPGGDPYRGNLLYVSGVLVNTTGIARRFTLEDHGIALDKESDDGWYTGGIHLRPGSGQVLTHVQRTDPPGLWYLFVFAQDVNSVVAGTAPFDAAHTIGGFVVTNQLTLAFDQPCQLKQDAVIQVV